MIRTTDRPNVLGAGLRALAALALLSLIAPAICDAGLVITAEAVTANPGSTGSFDVYLTNTGPSAVDISSDVIKIALTGVSGVSFTGATIATRDYSYIYVDSGTTFPGADPFSNTSFPNTSFLAADTEFGSLGYRVINANSSYGLAHVSYSITASAIPSVGSITIDPSLSSFADQNDASLTFSTTSARFTIASVPEPSSLVLCGLGLASVLASVRARLGSSVA